MAAGFSRFIPSVKRVSTHSHPKVAAASAKHQKVAQTVSTHSHPKVAAYLEIERVREQIRVSTHSHPKVAA